MICGIWYLVGEGDGVFHANVDRTVMRSNLRVVQCLKQWDWLGVECEVSLCGLWGWG